VDIETTFVEANGLRFEVDQCGSGDRLALCLHGFPESKFSWREQLPMLASLGYRAWAPNLRGYGKTTRPTRVRDYAMPHLLDDIAALIDASGARETTLIAHDWGAVIAWVFAMRRVRPLQKLAILNVPHPGVFVEKIRTLAQLRKSWYMFFFQLPVIPELGLRRGRASAIAGAFVGMAVDKSKFPREVTDVYRQNALEPGALTAMINYYRALFRHGRGELKQGYPLIETPTLIVWGEADKALGKETTYGTDRFVKNLTIRYLPNVSHWVQQEAPDVVNAMLEAFLTDRPVPEMYDVRAAPAARV
jgi:pimeloyl-ACP methyl ester carboxylesterase